MVVSFTPAGTVLTGAALDIRKTFDCGQCFRFAPDGGGYTGVAFGRVLHVTQDGGSIILHGVDRAAYEAVWADYFDLARDYEALSDAFCGDEALRTAYAFSRGIRILAQDPWETLCSFILSQNNNIPRIRKNLRDLCAMQGGAFPTPVALAAAQPETLRALGLGYRAEYLCAAGAHFAQADALDALRAMSYPEAHTALRAVKGVGPKVADCICLFGLHHVDAFPVDTHVKQILSAHYPKGFPFRRYAGCAGILQQYMFYYDLHGSAQAAP